MIYLKAVILAIVEGATEFLPVSSTGHLILVERLFQLSEDTAFNNSFMIVIQLPAICAVILYFWTDLWPFGTTGQKRATMYILWAKILVAFLPAVVLGLLFEDLINHYLFDPLPVALALLTGGFLLIIIEKTRRGPIVLTVADVTFKIALAIGFFQCLAMIPGTSRSAATIIGAMLLGLSRPAAAEFSFFLAIPTMLGATAYTLAKSGLSFTAEQWAVVAIGSIVSFGVAYAVIAVFMNYIRKHDFIIFGYYRIVLASVILALLAFR